MIKKESAHNVRQDFTIQLPSAFVKTYLVASSSKAIHALSVVKDSSLIKEDV